MLPEPTEPTASQARPEKTQSWIVVLAMAFAIYVASEIPGMVGGGLLILGLVEWLAGPGAFRGLSDLSTLPAEAQALLSINGWSLCGSLFSVPAGIVLLRLAVPRAGPAAREYLGLKWPGLRQGLGWGLILVASDYGYRFLVSWLGMTYSNDDRYSTILGIPLFLPLIFVSLAVLVPIFEELLLRGYLLEGLRRSRLGEIGAILITAILWAALHPDTPARLVGLFLDGILLALARLRTGSTYLTILVHALHNARFVLVLAND